MQGSTFIPRLKSGAFCRFSRKHQREMLVRPPGWSDHAKQRLRQRWHLKPAPWIRKRLSQQLSEGREAWLLLAELGDIEHWCVRHYDKDQGALWIPCVVNVSCESIVTVQPAESWWRMSYSRVQIEDPWRGELEHWLQGATSAW